MTKLRFLKLELNSLKLQPKRHLRNRLKRPLQSQQKNPPARRHQRNQKSQWKNRNRPNHGQMRNSLRDPCQTPIRFVSTNLARDLEVKAKAILDYLPEIGVTEKKTHSSSIDVAAAEKVRKHFQQLAQAEAVAEAAAVTEKAARKPPRRPHARVPPRLRRNLLLLRQPQSLIHQ